MKMAKIAVYHRPAERTAGDTAKGHLSERAGVLMSEFDDLSWQMCCRIALQDSQLRAEERT
jgi:hypothetical protein